MSGSRSPRPLVLDASPLFAAGADPAGSDAALLRHLAAGHCASAVRGGARRMAGLSRTEIAACFARADNAADDDSAFQATRDWLIGATTGPPPPRPNRRPGGALDRLARLVAPPAFAPRGAALLRTGLHGWDDPVLGAWLAARPDLVPVGLPGAPVALDFPEYVLDEPVATQRRIAAMVRQAKLLVVPSEAARARIAAAIGPEARRGLSIHVVAEPSRLAGTLPSRSDPVLAQVPYVVAAGPIDSCRNVLLVLTLWRDLLLAGATVPKLVLAGPRGQQIEAIRPLLDWSERLGPHVREAPDLAPQGLRDLVSHARAVLAPAFHDRSGAFPRDVARLGIPVLASDIPAYREVPGERIRLLNPIDGLAWRNAVRTLGQMPPPAEAPAPALAGWPAYLAVFDTIVASL